jgi:quinoprotein glucose dehydrogenase
MRDFGGAYPAVPPGSLTLGGPIVTASGLIFIAGTVDASLHALDVDTGRELWTGALPASGHATPMTYKLSASGKQYVVIAAGGHAKVSEERLGDTLVAFALSP